MSALEIAAPLLAALFLAEAALGLLARAAPQMNIFQLGLPVKILVTLHAGRPGPPAPARRRQRHAPTRSSARALDVVRG